GMDGIFEVPQPVIGDHGRHGCGDDEGYEQQAEELFAEQPADLADACAEDFADADLFGLAQRHKGDEAIETETADEDGDAGEDFHEGKEDVIHEIEFGDAVVEEGVGIDIVGIGPVPCVLDAGECFVQLVGIDLDAAGFIAPGFRADAERLDLAFEGILMKVFDDADHGGGYAICFDELTEHLMRRGQAELFYEGLVNEEFANGIAWVEVSAGEEVQAEGGEIVVVCVLDVDLPAFGMGPVIVGDVGGLIMSGSRRLVAEGEVFNAWDGSELVPERMHPGGVRGWNGYRHDRFFVEADVQVIRIVHLPGDDDHAYDEQLGDGELGGHEDAAEREAADVCLG